MFKKIGAFNIEHWIKIKHLKNLILVNVCDISVKNVTNTKTHVEPTSTETRIRNKNINSERTSSAFDVDDWRPHSFRKTKNVYSANNYIIKKQCRYSCDRSNNKSRIVFTFYSIMLIEAEFVTSGVLAKISWTWSQ